MGGRGGKRELIEKVASVVPNAQELVSRRQCLSFQVAFPLGSGLLKINVGTELASK